jgi:threonine-phosphate decarboxylase
MSQAFHGGGLQQAAERFGLSPDSLVDFSSNVNVLAPPVPAADWERWLPEIYRYPELGDLRQRLADFYDVRAEYILPTAGAIEALYLAARLFAGCRVAVLEPSFSDYGRAFNTVPGLAERIVLSPDTWTSAAQIWAERLEPFDVVILGNPNNPTGHLLTPADFAALFDRSWARPKRWIVDEAFIDFVFEPASLLSRLTDYPSLIVLRSLTKSWRIPGLRFGFAATAGQMPELERMQPPWSVNGLVQAWAREFLRPQRRAEYQASLRMLVTLREDFAANLGRIPGIRVYPSAANFLLLEITDSAFNADQIYVELGSQGLLVRTCDSFYGMPKGRFLRVAVRTAPENQRFVDTLSKICVALSGQVAIPPGERRELPIPNPRSPVRSSHCRGST